ncbi:MAG: hypothetical protein ACYTA3_10020 [Planctomycetota bacterium]|jgi:hypothetical protein
MVREPVAVGVAPGIGQGRDGQAQGAEVVRKIAVALFVLHGRDGHVEHVRRDLDDLGLGHDEHGRDRQDRNHAGGEAAHNDHAGDHQPQHRSEQADDHAHRGEPAGRAPKGGQADQQPEQGDDPRGDEQTDQRDEETGHPEPVALADGDHHVWRI